MKNITRKTFIKNSLLLSTYAGLSPSMAKVLSLSQNNPRLESDFYKRIVEPAGKVCSLKFNHEHIIKNGRAGVSVFSPTPPMRHVSDVRNSVYTEGVCKIHGYKRHIK